jgi:hypothetical protein
MYPDGKYKNYTIISLFELFSFGFILKYIIKTIHELCTHKIILSNNSFIQLILDTD